MTLPSQVLGPTDSPAGESRVIDARARFAPALSYDELRRRATELVEAGEYHEALVALEAAQDEALASGDQVLADRAACNRSAVAMEIGSPEPELPTLREILGRSGDLENCWAAANALARAAELQKAYKKGIFYARIARDRAEWLKRPDWLAHSYNRLGNLLLAESHVDEASENYERALEIIPVDPPVWRAQVLDNVGYCRVLDGRLTEGLEHLYQSVRTLVRCGADRHRVSGHLDLAFALLEAERYRYAAKHAATALQLAERFDDEDSVKNALYLLGEAQLKAADGAGADASFRRLQTEFFPDNPQILSWLREVDVRDVVNLRA